MYRNVFLNYCVSNSGENREENVVQIYEAKFDKRKNLRGLYLEGKCIFGGIEIGIKKSFFVHVDDRPV